MKSALNCFALASLLMMLGGAGSVFAQQDEPEGDQERTEQGQAQQTEEQDQDAEPADDEAREGDEDSRRSRRGAGMPMRKVSSTLIKLQAMTKERLRLKPDQERAIDQLFEKQLQSLKEAMARDRKPRSQGNDLEKLKEMQRELLEAREAGDKERAREIREKMGEMLRQRGRGMVMPIGRFLGQVEAELDEEQVSAFRELAKRLGFEEPRRWRGRPLMYLMRALRAPEIGLSDEQREKTQELQRKYRSVMRDADEEQRNEAFAALHEAIMAELTAEQQAKLEAEIEGMKKRDAERHRKAPRRRSHGDDGEEAEVEPVAPKDTGD